MSAPARDIVPAWDHAPLGPDAGPRHVLRREHFGALVYDRETCCYVPYDAEAAALLLGREVLAGDRVPSDGAPPGFVAALQEDELLDADGRLSARVVEDAAHPGRLSAPLTVYVGATEGCNLACSHCQADSGPGPLRPLARPLMERLFREQHALGCMQVHVSGGEPLLHPELLPALDEAFRLGLTVMLTTNGTVLTEPLVEELAARPFRCLSVSLDGADPSGHDAIRGEGALARALAGLRLLSARGGVGVTATFTPALAGRLLDLARLCEEHGAASLTLRPALPAGRALRARRLLPSFDQFLAASAELDAAQAQVGIPLFRPSEVPHQNDSARVLERFGCVAGNLVCSVTPSGQVNPCALLGPGFDAGSLEGSSLRALWGEGEPFRRLRALEGNPDCWSCRHYDYCGGGCRARALAAGRGLHEPDPWCSYEPLEGAR